MASAAPSLLVPVGACEFHPIVGTLGMTLFSSAREQSREESLSRSQASLSYHMEYELYDYKFIQVISLSHISLKNISKCS